MRDLDGRLLGWISGVSGQTFRVPLEDLTPASATRARPFKTGSLEKRTMVVAHWSCDARFATIGTRLRKRVWVAKDRETLQALLSRFRPVLPPPITPAEMGERLRSEPGITAPVAYMLIADDRVRALEAEGDPNREILAEWKRRRAHGARMAERGQCVFEERSTG